MSDYVVYLTVPEYLAQWINHTFGNPVELIKDSPESRVLNECLTKTPANSKPDLGEGSNIIIKVPYFKGKDPAVYSYLYESGKRAIIESFRTLLVKNLMAEVGSLSNANVKIATLIYMWMEKHGIDEKHWDTISQIFYRTRKRYFEEKGIKI